MQMVVLLGTLRFGVKNKNAIKNKVGSKHTSKHIPNIEIHIYIVYVTYQSSKNNILSYRIFVNFRKLGK